MIIHINPSEEPAAIDRVSRWRRFWSWPTDPIARRRKTIKVIALVVVLLLIGVGLSLRHQLNNTVGTNAAANTESFANVATNQPAATVISPLDGKAYDPALVARRPLAIMVENHPDARPQYGLSQASVVYEAIAEGGITRYMTVWGPTDADRVGPIRSARTYYIDWALEYNAVYVHAGGSAPALAKLSSDKKINQIDQQNPPTMWRQRRGSEASEHTLYGSTSKLRDYATAQGWSMQRNFDGWSFADDKRTAEEKAAAPVKTISIPFSSASFLVSYTYDPTTNTWLRSLAGKADKDAGTSQQISPTNVIVQTMNRHDVMEPGNKMIGVLDLNGSGPAWVFKGGQVTVGTWKKTAEYTRTRYYDAAGVEIPLYPGQTFVEIIQPDIKITF